MKEHGILFSPAMLAAIRSGTKSETRRLQPRHIKVGDRIWVKEALRALYHPDFLVPDQAVVYSIDEYPAYNDGHCMPWTWKLQVLPARVMPKWAARTWLTVKEVRIEPLSCLDDATARHEGFGTVAEFQAYWNLLHPRIPFSDDPLVQVIVFEVEKKE